MKTLEQIIAKERERRVESGMFGIKACKESVLWDIEHRGKTLYGLLEEYVKRANEECCFNNHMVLAVWELINEQ